MQERFDLHRTTYSVADFLTWQKNKTLTLSPFFQRRSVWKPGAKSYLMDSIIRGLPVPILLLRDLPANLESYEPEREVVDGQQRLRTIISYVDPGLLPDFDPERDSFKLLRSHNKKLAGKKFKDLDKEIRQSILDYKFSVHVFPGDTSDSDIVQIFARLNSTGTRLNKQELRNAEFFGEMKTMIYELSSEQINRWIDWGIFSPDDISRMEEVELVGELVLMIDRGEVSGKSQSALNALYRDNEENYPYSGEMASRFRSLLDEIDMYLAPRMSELQLSKKALFYPLAAAVYSQMYEWRDIASSATAEKISKSSWNNLYAAAHQIQARQAPQNVLESVDRRTTNPIERGHLYTYFKNGLEN